MGNKIFKGLKFPGMDDYYVLPEAVITKNEDGIIEIESYMHGESNIVIDKTLSASGAVAEAKAVGDALQNKVSVVEGSRLMTQEEANKLAKLVIDEDGTVGSTDVINVGNAEGILAITHGGTGNTTGYIQTGAQNGSSIGNKATIEGANNIGSGESSHVEGASNTASGDYSHAEGMGTVASEYASHAEGRNTLASSSDQHVQGRYNIEDTDDTYAHIVGNGDPNTRSNAHTLDWDGNAWFAGAVDCEDAVTTLDNLGALNLAHVPDGDTDHLIPENADLNDYITPGAYRCATSAIAKTLSNMTSYVSAGFRLIVSGTSTGNGSVQFIIFNSGVGRLWFRIRTGIDTWGDWRHIITDGNIVDTVYPVGSIYLSVESTSPASLFGGTWTQLKDRFLLGAGSSYTAGNTSGSKSTTLKEANLPAHTHGLRSTTVSVGSSGGVKDITVLSTSSSSSESYITSTGSATSFTNMPPYLVVYMWKRTE